MCRLLPVSSRYVATWVRLFGRERPVDWTDRTPPSPAALACRRRLIRRTGLTGPAPPHRPPHPATSMWQPRCSNHLAATSTWLPGPPAPHRPHRPHHGHRPLPHAALTP